MNTIKRRRKTNEIKNKAEQGQFIYFPIRTACVCVCVAFHSQNFSNCTHCNRNEFDLIMCWTLLLQPRLMSSSHPSWMLAVWAIRKFLGWKNRPQCSHRSKTMCEMCSQGKCVCGCVRCLCVRCVCGWDFHRIRIEDWMDRLMFLSFQRVITSERRGRRFGWGPQNEGQKEEEKEEARSRRSGSISEARPLSTCRRSARRYTRPWRTLSSHDASHWRRITQEKIR